MSKDNLGNEGKTVLSISHFKFREILKASGIEATFTSRICIYMSYFSGIWRRMHIKPFKMCVHKCLCEHMARECDPVKYLLCLAGAKSQNACSLSSSHPLRCESQQVGGSGARFLRSMQEGQISAAATALSNAKAVSGHEQKVYVALSVEPGKCVEDAQCPSSR